MKTILRLKKQFVILLLFFMMGLGNVLGQTTYSGSPSTAATAVCPTTTAGSSCSLTFNPKYKLYVSSISGSTVNLVIEVCTGSSLSTGTFYLKEGDACGTQIDTWAVSGSSGPYYRSINVSHTGTKNYTLTNTNTAGTTRTYSNSISVTGTANTPPTLKAETCFNFTSSTSLIPGQTLSGSIGVRNTPSSQSWTGTVTVFIRQKLSPFQQQTLSTQTLTLGGGNTQTISFSTPLTVTGGGYQIYCKYSNSPNGGEDYIVNNGCITCNGLGCLSTITPSAIITVTDQPNLVCGTATVSPTNPITEQTATFSFPITNTGSGNYTGGLQLWWRNATNVGSALPNNYIASLGAGLSHTFTHPSTPLQSVPGTYYLRIEKDNGEVVCTKTVTVVAAPAGCITWTGTPPTGEKLTAANYLCDAGIISNTQNGTDNAANGIPRELLAKITYLGIYKNITQNSPAVNFPVPFTDMQGSSLQYLDAIKTLAYLQFNDEITPFDRDLINFNPNTLIARKYVIKAFAEAFNIGKSSASPSPFTDVATSDPMYGYIKRFHELGLITGNQVYTSSCTTGTCFHPDANITREDVFVVLYRILNTASIIKPTATQLNSISSYFVPGNNRMATMGKVPNIDHANFNHYQKTSFSIAGRGVSLDFTHTYNSFLTELPKGFFEQEVTNTTSQNFTPLGIGWTHTYNIYAQKITGYTFNGVTEPDKLMIYYPDGSINTFNYATNAPDGIGIYDVMTKTAISGGERITITTKGQIKYVFENFSNGKFYFIKSIKDRNNNGVDCTWSTYLANIYRLTKVQENNNGTLGRFLTFNYNALSPYITSVVDNSINRTITFNVDALSKNLFWFRDAKNQQTTYTYDTSGSLLGTNLLTQILLPKGNKITNTYVQNKLRQSQTFSNANVVTSTTNVNWVQNYSSSGYNSNSTVTEPPTPVSPTGRSTSYTHNTNGNPTNIISPTGTTSLTNYAAGNNANLPQNLTVNGQSSNITYDDNGNILSISKNGITNSFTYTTKNDVLKHTDGRGFETNYTYDSLVGNLLSVQRPSGGGTTSISRNSFGQVSSITNPSGIQTSFGYDINTGLTNQITLPLGIQTSSVYDNASRLVSTTDANGKTTSYEYDFNDNLTRSINPLLGANGTVDHTYDDNDNHLTVKNPKNETQTNEYNWDDDTLWKETFGSHVKTYTYNTNGTLATFTRGNGTFNYTYDATTGRLLNDGQTQYTYDVRGNIKTVTNTNGTLTLNYDNNDRLLNYIDYYNNTVAYLYDNNNNVTRITYPGNKQVNYVYDAVNRCTSVTDWNGKITSYTYLPDDRVSKITLPNGTFTDYTYDAAARPSGIVNKKANGTIITSYGFTMDNAGNHLTETITEPSIIAGLETITGETTNYGLYPFNRIQSQGSSNFTHYTEGSIQTKGSSAFTYDLNDNMLTAPNSTFSYDGAGNRRAKTVSGANTRYVLSIIGISQVLMETNSINVAQNFYVYGPTGLLYRVKADNTTYSYYHYDYRGSTTAITNEAQNVTHSYSYDPFGRVLAKTEVDANPFQYVGQHGVQYESPSLTFMRARYYDPTTGRFVSEDPIWHLNLYPYADNNPVMGIDPDGFETVTAFAKNYAISVNDYDVAYLDRTRKMSPEKWYKKGTANYAKAEVMKIYAEMAYWRKVKEIQIQEEKKKQQAIVKNLPKYNFNSEGNLMIKRMDGLGDGYSNLGSPNGISRYSYDVGYIIASFSEQIAYYQSKGVRALMNFLRSQK